MVKALSVQLDTFFIGRDFYFDNFIDTNTGSIACYSNNLYVYADRDFIYIKNKALKPVVDRLDLCTSLSFFVKYLGYKKTDFYYPTKSKTFFSDLTKLAYFRSKKNNSVTFFFCLKGLKKNFLFYSFGSLFFISKKLFFKKFSLKKVRAIFTHSIYKKNSLNRFTRLQEIDKKLPNLFVTRLFFFFLEYCFKYKLFIKKRKKIFKLYYNGRGRLKNFNNIFFLVVDLLFQDNAKKVFYTKFCQDYTNTLRNKKFLLMFCLLNFKFKHFKIFSSFIKSKLREDAQLLEKQLKIRKRLRMEAKQIKKTLKLREI